MAWFKESWMVKKANKKPPIFSHERRDKHRTQESWKEQPKRKLNEKEAKSY